MNPVQTEPVPAPTAKPSVQRVIEAHRAREAAFEAADAARAAARRKASRRFAAVIKREVATGSTNMSELARSVGLSRQVLHGIMRDSA